MLPSNFVMGPLTFLQYLCAHPDELEMLSNMLWSAIKLTRSFKAWKTGVKPVHVLRTFQTPLLKAIYKLRRDFNIRELIETATEHLNLTHEHQVDRILVRWETLVGYYEKLEAIVEGNSACKLGSLMIGLAVLMLQEEVENQVLAKWKQSIVKFSMLVGERYLEVLVETFSDIPTLTKEEPMELDLESTSSHSDTFSMSPPLPSTPSTPKNLLIPILPETPYKWKCEMMKAYMSHDPIAMLRIAGDHVFDGDDIDMVGMLVSLAVEDLVANGYLENGGTVKQERGKFERLTTDVYTKLKKVFDETNGNLDPAMVPQVARELGITEQRKIIQLRRADEHAHTFYFPDIT